MKTTTSNDIEELTAQFAALREDMAKLSNSVLEITERRGSRLASDISDGVGEAAHYVASKGKNAEAELEKSVAAHPLLALGLAAGVGLLIGAMTRR